MDLPLSAGPLRDSGGITMALGKRLEFQILYLTRGWSLGGEGARPINDSMLQ